MSVISIIVCTYNRAKELNGFLERLESHVLNSKLDADIVLVDNNSSDNTPTVLSCFEANTKLKVTIAQEKMQGANFARNTGIRNARSQLLVFTDDDVGFSDTWLIDFLKYMDAHPKCQVATGYISPMFLKPRPKWLDDSMLNIYGQQDYGEKPIDLQFPNFPVEMNMVIRAIVFERYGNFSTEFSRDDKTLMSNDGKSFFYKLSHHNTTVKYIPNAKLFHLIPDSRIKPEWVMRRFFWQGVSDIAFQDLINKEAKTSGVFKSLIDLIKLLNIMRGKSISPKKIYWHWHALPVKLKATHAYKLGILFRKLGWK